MTDGEGRPSPYQEALALLDDGKLSKALDFLRWTGRDLDPLAYDEAWAEVELARHEFGAAAGRADQTLAAGRETRRLHEIAAEALFRLGSREEAKSHSEMAGLSTARSAHLRARIAMSEGDFASAERFAELIRNLDPEYWSNDAILFASRAAQGDRDARVELRKLWEESHDPWTLYLLILDAHRRKDVDMVGELVSHTLATLPITSGLLATLMWASNELRQWEQTIATFDAAPEAARNTVYNLRTRGRAAMAKEDYFGAIGFLERAYAMEPRDEWTMDSLSRALLKTGQWMRFMRMVREHNQSRKSAGISEGSVREYARNLRWRTGWRRRR